MSAEVYSVRTVLGGWRVVKFDQWLNVVTIREVRGTLVGTMTCSCYRKYHHTDYCKHRLMIPLFIQLDRVDKGWFYDYENQQWHTPVTEEFQLIKRRMKERRHD